MNRSKRFVRLAIFTSIVTIAVCLIGGYVVSKAVFSYRPVPQKVDWKAQWIKAQGQQLYSGSFRKDVFLTSNVRRAWIRVAAKEAYELIVNGDTASRSYLWRPTRPFQNGLSEFGQRLNFSQPLLALNFPREYQWSGHKEYMLPTYIDITNALHKGNNAITVIIESRKADAALILEGAIELNTGEVITIRSDETWNAWRTPPASTQLDWMNPNLPPPAEGQVVLAEQSPSWYYSITPPEIYSIPFQAEIIRPNDRHKNATVIFESTWHIDSTVSSSWLRLLTNRSYDLYINDKRVNTNSYGAKDLAMGEWVLDSTRILDPSARPTLLDPDEVGHVYTGKNFLSPRHSDPTVNDFRRYENQLNRTKESPGQAGLAPEQNSIFSETQKINPNAASFSDYRPEGRVPEALTRNRESYQFVGYNITSMLKKGGNKIRVHLNPADHALPLNWLPCVAIDAEAATRSGTFSSFSTSTKWRTKHIGPNLEGGTQFELASSRGKPGNAISLPDLKYRGFAYNQKEKFKDTTMVTIIVTIVVLGSILIKFNQTKVSAESLSYLSRYQLLFPLSILLGVVMIRMSWVERYEYVWLHYPWIWLFGASAALIALGLGSMRVKRLTEGTIPSKRRGMTIVEFIHHLPSHPYWKGIIFSVLLISFCLRAYHLDYQTIDDDEYASIQASIAIAEKGVPEYSEDVWYTRSPLFHYLSGALIWLFGANLWTFRLPPILFGVATTWLCYRASVRLLGCPWLGIGAMLLYAFHPFLIFSSHIARFYQQQQFFALLTAYWFCLGFVSEQTMKYRYLTLAAYLAAILTQELSVIIGVQLLFGYLIFARRKPWKDELSLLAAAVCVVAITAIDIAVFQTRTLTRTEGISPNVEATLAPNFSSPMNFLSVFFSYSRLHLSLSVLFFIGLPLAFKNANRNVLAMYYMMFSGILFCNVLVSANSLRYQYWIIPLWIMLGLYCVKAILDYLDGFAIRARRRAFALGRMHVFISSILFLAVFISWSPWRIPGSYTTKILGDASGAFQYIRTHMRPDDRVGATEPHPHGILLETGRADYDIAMPLLYDFVYLKDGELRDRNANARVINTVEKLQSEFAQHERVWIAINREKFRSRGKNLRWEYPGARAELFLRQQCSIEYQSYLWTVFLWDANRANYRAFRQHWNR